MTEIPTPTKEQFEWIANVAKSAAHTYSDVDVEDIYQQLVLNWYEKHHRITEYLTDPDTGRGKACIIRELLSWAADFAKTETAAANHAHPDDYHRYSRAQIKLLLPLIDSPEAWTTLAMSGEGGRSSAPLHERGTGLALYGDMRRAWASLSPHDQEILTLRYVGGETPLSEVSVTLGVSEATAKKRAERAVGRMQRFLGGSWHPARGGARHALSNAAAQALTRTQLDGG